MLGATVLIPFLIVPAMGGSGQGEGHLSARPHHAARERNDVYILRICVCFCLILRLYQAYRCRHRWLERVCGVTCVRHGPSGLAPSTHWTLHDCVYSACHLLIQLHRRPIISAPPAHPTPHFPVALLPTAQCPPLPHSHTSRNVSTTACPPDKDSQCLPETVPLPAPTPPRQLSPSPHPQPPAALLPAPSDLANVICTIFFVSGVITLVQTFVGDRLPIIQGGSFAYLTPTFAIIAQVAARGTFADTPEGQHERFLVRAVDGAASVSMLSDVPALLL
jgi:hypothetical protein